MVTADGEGLCDVLVDNVVKWKNFASHGHNWPVVGQRSRDLVVLWRPVRLNLFSYELVFVPPQAVPALVEPYSHVVLRPVHVIHVFFVQPERADNIIIIDAVYHFGPLRTAIEVVRIHDAFVVPVPNERVLDGSTGEKEFDLNSVDLVIGQEARVAKPERPTAIVHIQHWLCLNPLDGALSSQIFHFQVVPIVVQQDVVGEPSNVA